MKKMHGISTKAFAALLAVTLLVGSAIGGTLAWLTATPVSVTNTFTIGNVGITLTETGASGAGNQSKNFTVIPGVNIAKDPKVTVTADSEACYVFVKVDKQEWNDNLTYTVNTDAGEQKQLEGNDGVYYREVNADDAKAGKSFYVLKGSEKPDDLVGMTEEDKGLALNGIVRVSPDLKKDEWKEGTKLTFTAYAVQSEGLENVNDAWNQVKDL